MGRELVLSGLKGQRVSGLSSLGTRSLLFRIGCLKFESIANHLRIRSVLCTRNSKTTTRPMKSGSSRTMGPGSSSTMRAAPPSRAQAEESVAILEQFPEYGG